MKICPNCKSELIAADLQSNRCSRCHGSLVSQESDDQFRTAQFDDATIDGTFDLGTFDQSINSTQSEETFDPNVTMPPDDSSNGSTIDLSNLSLGDVGQTLGTDIDRTDASPGATISLGEAGLMARGTVANSPQTGNSFAANSPQATVFLAASEQTVGPVRRGSTAQNSASASGNFSIDDNSILSTISKRTLAEGTNDLASSPDYKIVKKLGEGGMGVVYSAIQKTLDRKVAIKAIKSSKAVSDESKRKFFYEAQITGDLDHPNIVPIHDMGSNDDGTLFYSMKMVDGTPWEDVLVQKSREENLEIFMKVCDAVAFAHSRNIIHRDLKPENVMLGAFGEVLVMDWGLAVNLDTTKTFGMSGTPVYMAPEMAKHELSKIGKASDIYILGAILFQIIVGRAPHKGTTVRECLANAAKNINIETDIDDPLLDIANCAMATEPADRYTTVVEFQDAIREHLRYAQSILLTQRAEELLITSTENLDYQGFSRALFSMQDAIELWPGNEAAKEGLHRTRLAYGQCALDKGDYDLCLQTLDQSQPAEKLLFDSALEKKQEIAQREKRLRLMRWAIAALILFTGISLTLATLYAQRQEKIARDNESIAIKAAASEKNARMVEAEAKQVALEERNRAQRAAEDEKTARQNEAKAKELAQSERDKAIEAELQEKLAKDKEVVAREAAVASEQKAILSEQVAVQNARFALLGNYQSKLNLALAQSNQLDIVRSSQLLEQIKTIESGLGIQSSPMKSSPMKSSPVTLQNWAYRRIALLNNQDLSSLHVDGQVTAVQYLPKRNLGAIGTSRGVVQLFRIVDQAVSVLPDRKINLPSSIQSIAIAPDGTEATIAVASNSNSSMLQWNFNDAQAKPIPAFGRRALQRLAISPKGDKIVGGINSGLWFWDPTNNTPVVEPRVLDCRGELNSLEFVGSDSNEVFGFSTLPDGKQHVLLANFTSNQIQLMDIPESIDSTITAAAISKDGKFAMFGCEDGRIFLSNRNATSPSQFAVASELLPRKHSAAIRSIQLSEDGTAISCGDEPVVHVWKSNPVNGELGYAHFLAGLPGNIVRSLFLADSNAVLGADDRGNIMVWDVLEQQNRKMQSYETPSRIISQSMRSDRNVCLLDDQGTLRIGGLNAKAQYVGHSPGALITDMAVASREPLVATIAKLNGLSSAYSSAGERTSEVCIWDTRDDRMIRRASIASTSACRIAFAENDNTLFICDSRQTYRLPTKNSIEMETEDRFGATFAIPHPQRPNLTALVAASGAVRIVDSNDTTKWDAPGYRYFDLAINNRFPPIEAAWSSDGERLYLIFEHGRIARLDWKESTLQNLCWSPVYASIQSLEQEAPWRFLDFVITASDSNVDSIEVVVRSAESKPKSNWLQLTWNRNSTTPEMFRERTYPEIRYGSPTNREPLEASRVLADIPAIERFDCKFTQEGRSISSDRFGSLWLSNAETEKPKRLGRPPCVVASHDNESTRWVTGHAHGIAWLATCQSENNVSWTRIEHPFVSIQDCRLSPDGKRVALLGNLPNAAVSGGSLLCLAIDDSGKAKREPEMTAENVRMVRWHPDRNQLLILDAKNQWNISDIGSENAPLVVNDHGWSGKMMSGGFECFDLQWLHDAQKTATSEPLNLVLLSRSKTQSRIDFIPLDPAATQLLEPVISNIPLETIATAPSESILATGDSNGTLSIWYAAPSLDREPRELFTLPGHRGSAISQLSFSTDGACILSSDQSKRAIQWNSLRNTQSSNSVHEKIEHNKQ